MPVIHTHVSVSTTPGQREALKAAYGKAITAVPGKSEGWLMCPFEDNMPIYFGGDDSKPAAYVEVNVFGRSVPGSAWEKLTEQIMAALQEKKVRVTVDATGDLLLNVLKYRPFLIKPNQHELGELFGRTLKTGDDIRACAAKLQDKGARNVLVSLAGDGAILLDETGQFQEIGVPRGTVRNAVGAGDSMVAGFLAGYLKLGTYSYALRMGAAAGSATAFSDELATKEEILKLLNTF